MELVQKGVDQMGNRIQLCPNFDQNNVFCDNVFSCIDRQCCAMKHWREWDLRNIGGPINFTDEKNQRKSQKITEKSTKNKK